MSLWIRAVAPALVFAASVVARADTYVDTFDGGFSAGGWTYFFGGETFPATGGNPGAYLRANGLDTYAPRPATNGASIFTGDYRTAGITSIGVDLITHYVDFSADGRPLALLLYSDNGTPGVTNDDWAAYTLGANIPTPGQGWLSYDFDVPSDATTLPPGWATIALGPSSPPVPDWNDVIVDVARLGFHYGDPTFFFIFQMWDVGLDNARITYDSAVSAEGAGVQASSWGGIKATFR